MFLGHSAMILFVALLALCKSLFLTIAAGEWHPWLVEDSASGEGFLIDSYYEEHGDPLAQAVPVTLLELQQQPDALTKQNLAKSQNLLHCQCQFTKIPTAATPAKTLLVEEDSESESDSEMLSQEQLQSMMAAQLQAQAQAQAQAAK